MNDYEQYGRYVDYNMYDVGLSDRITEIGKEYLQQLINEYNEDCSDWFEDETFVEKEIPEFNFV